MRVYRLIVGLFGALPATILGSFALGVTLGGLRMVIGAELGGGLLLIWGALGLAGVAGLWLVVLEGPDSRGTAVLVACGLVADAVLIALAIRGGLYAAADAPPVRSSRLSSMEIVYCLLAVSPFVIGSLHIAQRFVRRAEARAL